MPQSPKAPTFKRLDAEADASHHGSRLDRFLSESLPELSRTRVQTLIKEGRVSLGGATIVDVKYRVKPGERFALDLPPTVPAEPHAEAIPLDVVYEDDALIVIDKPAGLVVHPGAGHLLDQPAVFQIQKELLLAVVNGMIGALLFHFLDKLRKRE